LDTLSAAANFMITNSLRKVNERRMLYQQPPTNFNYTACLAGPAESLQEESEVDDKSKCPVSGKRKYTSEREALATAAHQIATANAPKELRAYRCDWCDAWHLTKNAGKAGRR
jgi:hypothetical protein